MPTTISMQRGAYTIQFGIPSSFRAYGWFGYAEYDETGSFLWRFAYDTYNGEFDNYTVTGILAVGTKDYTASDDAYGFALFFRTFVNRNGTTEEELAAQITAAGERTSLIRFVESSGGSRLLPKVTQADNEKIVIVKDGVWTACTPVVPTSVNPNITSVNHRGYNSVAPENTLAAYRLSKKMGFEMVECDVSFTSDGYAVLLHDTTVDRTSDGTGTISELTFEYVRSLDFGSWKSSEYAGEQIPTFEEFIVLCRKLGLHPYIEIKTPVTQEQIGGW